MPKANKRKVIVFIASPSDLINERQWFREVVDQLNVGFGNSANVEFEPLGWEDTLASTGRRPQGLINADVDRCDVFILMMFRRWGQDAPDSVHYSSYTEEEFHRALDRFHRTRAPEIFVFFRRVDAASEADPDPQLEKVLAFRRQLEESRQVLYRYFDDSKQSFVNEIDKHLRAYTTGELVIVDKANAGVILPLELVEKVTKAKKEATKNALLAEEANQRAETAIFKVKALQLQSAEEAAYLAKEGQLVLARQKFVRVIGDTLDLHILFLAYEFFYRTGDLKTAVIVLERWLEISGPNKKTLATTAAYGNLGNIYNIWGDLERAEEMHKKALVTNKAFDYKKGMAVSYGNLGNIYRIRGELERAEEAHKKALAINESLNHIEGIADDYGNLGIIYGLRNKLDFAETFFKKSLSNNSSLDRKENMAIDYLNLGNIFLSRVELDYAEDMFKKALAIDEALGRKVGMADDYGSLGNIYIKRGMLDDAEVMFKKALAIDEALGRLEGMADCYGNLGLIYQTQDDLDNAEDMFKKALELYKTLQSPKSVDVEKWLANLQKE